MDRQPRSERTPTTEAGLPMDASQAVQTSGMHAFEQPVYRSLMVETMPQPLQAVPRFASDPVVRVQDDMALQKSLAGRSRASSIDSTSAATRPPKLEDALVLERTKFCASGDYLGVRARLVDCLHELGVALNASEGKPTLNCSAYVNGTPVAFDVNIFRADTGYVIEFQRRSGCPMLFNKLFRRAQAAFTDCKCNIPEITPQQLSALLQSSELTEESRNMGLEILRRWMREDAEEAAGALANLVSAGFLHGSDVVDLAMEFAEVSLVNALCSLSHLVRTDTLAVARHWPRLKRRLVTAFQNGDAHIVSEACELCCYMQSCARNYSDLVGVVFVDHDIISAARARLDRDSISAPFCLSVALRSMVQAAQRDAAVL